MPKIFDWFIAEYPKGSVNISSNSLSCHLVTAEPERSAKTVADLSLPAGGSYQHKLLVDINSNSNNRVQLFAKVTENSSENALFEGVDHTTDTFELNSHGLNNGDKVLITPETSSTLPAGITSDLLYVVSSTTNVFQVSTTENGSAIDFTDNGVGGLRVHYKEGIKLGSKFVMQNPLWPELTTGDNAPIVGLVTINAYTPSSSSQVISYLQREINGVPTPYTPDGSPFAFDLSTNGFFQLIQG